MSGYEGFAGASTGPREATGAAGLSDEHLVRRLKKLLLDEVDLHELGRLDEAQRRGRLSRVLTHMVSNEGIILSSRERTSLIQRVVDEAVGLGVLEPILADSSVSEIMINGHDTIYVERLDAPVGGTVRLAEVLLVGGEGEAKVGSPLLSQAAVVGTVLGEGRDKKVRVFKYKKRKHYRRTRGHRQSYTALRIDSIEL